MHDRPDAAELLEAIADLLEREVIAATEGGLQHRVRVAGNLCRILEREMQLGPEIEAREREALVSLLGPHAAGERDLRELNRLLMARFDAGADPSFERRAWQVLLAITRDKLRIVKPGHDDYDFAAEVVT